MLLFQDLVLALILSVCFSLLFVTAKAIGKTKRVPQFNDGFPESADQVFDEIPVRPGCDYDVSEAEEGGDNVGSIEKNRGLGFELEDDVFNESPMKSIKAKSCEIAMVKEISSGVLEFEDHIVDEIQDRAKDENFVAKSEKNYDDSKVFQEVKTESEIFGKGISSDIEFEENNKGLGSDDLRRSENEDSMDESWLDDWEGIERTILEKEFGDAVIFVNSKTNAHFISSFDNEMKMRLYGLHKVAIEGACCVQQPMALKVSARSKWNAWNLLGNMSREVAMEQYIALLSKSLPEWKRG